MFLPERMEQLNVLVFESELEGVTNVLVRLGVLHLSRLDDQGPWARDLQGPHVAETRAKIDSLRSRGTAILKSLGLDKAPVPRGDAPADLSTISLDEIERFETSLDEAVRAPQARRSELVRKLERMEAVAGQVSPLLALGLPIRRSGFTFLELHYGEVRAEQVEAVKAKTAPLAAVVLTAAKRGKKDLIVVIGLKSDRMKIRKILKDVDFEEIEIKAESKKEAPEITDEILERIEETRKNIVVVDAEIARIREASIEKIGEYNRALRAAAMLTRFKNYTKRTNKTYIFSGWIPRAERGAVEREIMEASHGRAIIETRGPDEVAGVREGKIKVPVLLRHPSFFKPFGLLISGYATPDYQTVDPTFFMAITFLTMFGVMFGDVGHGAVLFFLGWLLHRRSRDPGATMALFGRLGMYCGTSSMIFGLLFGSVFGNEEILPTLWMKPMEPDNIMSFLGLAVYWGIGMITLGMALNIYNAIRQRNFRGLLFDHGGILTSVMYWAGVIAISAFLSGRISGGSVVIALVAIVVAVLALFLKEPLVALATRTPLHFEHGIGMYLFESVLDVMEIFMGYLSNTVSFIRVAAFSLAHVGLFVAVFKLAGMVQGASGGPVYSALIQLFGNIGIIALEGLVVSIQAIRLEYYEFFGKFFFGGGVAYKPIGLRG
jgi:V/A-type H+/Na+-transporting ATPase subunit I